MKGLINVSKLVVDKNYKFSHVILLRENIKLHVIFSVGWFHVVASSNTHSKYSITLCFKSLSTLHLCYLWSEVFQKWENLSQQYRLTFALRLFQ